MSCLNWRECCGCVLVCVGMKALGRLLVPPFSFVVLWSSIEWDRCELSKKLFHWNLQNYVKCELYHCSKIVPKMLTHSNAFCWSNNLFIMIVPCVGYSFYPSALRAGGVLSSRFGRAGGRAGGCQTCGTHISVTAWRIFSIRSSMELSRPVVVHCHGNLPICPVWACPWAKNLSNLPQIGSRLCGTHISETAGWIYPI